MEHFYKNIPGWFSYDGLYKDAVIEYTNANLVEVGSYEGQSSAFMAVEIINSKKNIKFDCIDTWTNHNEVRDAEETYNKFITNMKPVEGYYTPIRMDSVEAAKLYQDESLDFIYIDADHSYESVKNDILAWFPKLKVNGILAGHDYPMEPVRRAVHELLGEKNISLNMCSWKYRKTQKWDT